MTKKRKIVIGIILGILVFIGGSVGKFQYDQYREKSYKQYDDLYYLYDCIPVEGDVYSNPVKK